MWRRRTKERIKKSDSRIISRVLRFVSQIVYDHDPDKRTAKYSSSVCRGKGKERDRKRLKARVRERHKVGAIENRDAL